MTVHLVTRPTTLDNVSARGARRIVAKVGLVGAVGLMAGREIRRRWRAALLLALLVAIVGTAVLASAAGARRTSTALDRFRTSSRSADLEVATDAPTPAQLDALRHVDGVAAVATLRAVGVQVPAAPALQSIGAVVDDQFGVVIDRDRIVAGRAPDPSVADEIAIGEGLAAQLHLRIGDHLDTVSFTPEQVAAILGGQSDVGSPSGPAVSLRIVGVNRRPLDLGLRGVGTGLLVLTPAFYREYADQMGLFGARLRIRTNNGASDVANVEAAARQILGDAFSMQGLAVETDSAHDTTDVLATALWIFSAVAAAAGAVAIGFVVTREISLANRDQATLRALGLSRQQRIIATASLALVASGAGAVIAAFGAVAASPLLPFGLARRADPDIGVHVDWWVILIGTVASVVVIIAVAFLAAWRASSLTSAAAATQRPRTSRTVDVVAAAGLPPTVANGIRMALQTGRGRTALPARSASVAAVVGVVGVTAVLAFAASLDHLVATPSLYGGNWDFQTMDITANTPCGSTDYGLAKDPGVARLSEVCYQNVVIDGRPVPALAFTSLRGDSIGTTIVAGRTPETADEIALGSKTMRALRKKIGDTVSVSGRVASRDYQIVGRVAFPALGQAQALADGVALTGDGYLPLFDQNIFFRYFVGDFAPGVDQGAVQQRIASIPQLDGLKRPALPGEVDRLRQINWFPSSLAALIGALGLYAVGYALITSVRRRRQELAILKTLGFSRRQVRATIAWQATTLATIGAVVGIPVGLLVGVQVWRRVADSLGVGTAARVPVLLLLVQIPIVLALANLIAFFPARAAARTRPADALRSE